MFYIKKLAEDYSNKIVMTLQRKVPMSNHLQASVKKD